MDLFYEGNQVLKSGTCLFIFLRHGSQYLFRMRKRLIKNYNFKRAHKNFITKTLDFLPIRSADILFFFTEVLKNARQYIKLTRTKIVFYVICGK